MNAVPPLPQESDFAGKVALVTGGSDGLGLHLAGALTALGCEVYVCGRDEAKGRRAAAALGPRAHFTRCDLASVAEATAFVRAAGESAGRIDYVVNNAAVDPRIPMAEATAEDFDRLIAINLRPCFLVSQQALPYLRRGTGKSIVHICTTNYMLGLSPFTVYNASKSGIIGLMRSMARELGPEGIRVNAVSPGWIMTQKQLREHVTPRDKEELLAAQSLRFLLTEEHVTPATLFLLSPAAAGITGQNLVVDAGKVMY